MLEVERLQNVFEVVIRQISNFKSIFSFISVENMSNIIFLFYLKASKEGKGLTPSHTPPISNPGPIHTKTKRIQRISG